MLAALLFMEPAGQAASAGGPLNSGDAVQRNCRQDHAQRWISANFAGVEIISGNLTGRTRVAAPAWVRGAHASAAKYAFSVRADAASADRRVAFTDVQIGGLRSSDHFGAAIRTERSARDDDAEAGIELYLSNVSIEPNWPAWQSYQATNYDGIVLDGAEAIYAQSLTVRNWNADSALDIKAGRSQFVDLQVSGPGHRPLRYWQPGPHYLVGSTIDKPGGGTLIWFRDCDAVTLYVHDTSFNDMPRLTGDMVQCESGTTPGIVYLAQNPSQTGALHPMFGSCGD